MAPRRIPPLTDGEARIMHVLWACGTVTVADVLAALKRKHAITYSTAQTMLRILEHKGYVTHEKVARAFVYRPLVDQRQARQRALSQLVSRLFNGSKGQLVLNVVEDGDIDDNELQELKRLLRSK